MHLHQSTANDIGRLVNDHLSPSEVTQAIGRLIYRRERSYASLFGPITSIDLKPEKDCLKQAEWEIKALMHVELCPDKTHAYLHTCIL